MAGRAGLGLRLNFDQIRRRYLLKARLTADSGTAATCSVFDARAGILLGSAFIDDRTLTGEDVSE
jgi:hypothetical protein